MKKQIYEVDSDGFILEIYVGNFDVRGNLINPVGNFVTADLPQPLPFYRPKWTGAKWVEGASQEEIEELTKVKPPPPTQEERIKMLEDTINFLLEL